MAKLLPQTLDIFAVDPTVTTLDASFPLTGDSDIFNIVHTTKLPGGFCDVEFEIDVPFGKYWTDWRLRRMLYRVKMSDAEKSIFEGRVHRMEADGRGTLWRAGITARGYFRNFEDGIDDAAHNANGSAIAQNLRDNLHADTDQLDSSNDEITASTADTLDIDFRDRGYTAWQTIVDPNGGLLTYDDANGDPIDLYIYEDRKVHYKSRNPSSLDWIGYVGGGVVEFADETAWEDIANAVRGVYVSGGSRTTTAFTTDQTSIDKWIRREAEAGSTSVQDLTSATAARDLLLAQRKDAQQRATRPMVLSRVFDTNGNEKPLCHVRAGDVIRIPNAIPEAADLDAVTLNGMTTFFIVRTRCDHSERRLEIFPDRESKSLSATLAKIEANP